MILVCSEKNDKAGGTYRVDLKVPEHAMFRKLSIVKCLERHFVYSHASLNDGDTV